jgi:hypothetical protein
VQAVQGWHAWPMLAGDGFAEAPHDETESGTASRVWSAPPAAGVASPLLERQERPAASSTRWRV